MIYRVLQAADNPPDRILSRYSVSQSRSVAGATRASTTRVSASPRTSQPAVIKSSRIDGNIVDATARSTSSVSVAPQMPGRSWR